MQRDQNQGFESMQEATTQETFEGNEEEVPIEDDPAVLMIHVGGEVKQPGVYECIPGSRIEDVIILAGGFTKKANQVYYNLAERVEDGQQIIIPNQTDAINTNTNEAENLNSSSNKININLATVDDLINLPGIGTAKAQLIISYREQNGSFQSIEDIMNIEGLKEGIFNKIKDQISV